MTKRLKVMIADDEITIVEGILKLYKRNRQYSVKGQRDRYTPLIFLIYS